MSETSPKNESSSQQVCSSSGVSIGGMCLNWKVIGGLAAVGVGIWAIAPNLIAGVAPLLLFAACPLSMMLMMRGMSKGQDARAAERSDSPSTPSQAHEGGQPSDLATLKAEHARLSAELERAQREVEPEKIR